MQLLLTAVAVDLAFSFSKYFLLNMCPTLQYALHLPPKYYLLVVISIVVGDELTCKNLIAFLILRKKDWDWISAALLQILSVNIPTNEST